MEIIAILLTIVMGIFAYVGFIVNEERRQGKPIPLIWEKEFWNRP
tara:strand:- start:11955 stop:12089 length:135 start_codon:yes stop_codon:yes gene_type:complete